jgi:outer membrane protein assembly factor BamB
VGGRIFTQGNRGQKSFVLALDLKTGKEIWSFENGPAYLNGYGDGPRGTPAVDGDVLYALSGEGDLASLEAASGKKRWTLNILKKFSAKIPGWGISESPLIVGRLLICTPGGPDATLAALDKQTGETIWTSKGISDEAAYSSPIAFEAAGMAQVVNFTQKGVVGVALEDGRFLWRYDRVANGVANVATPIYHDGAVFASSGYDTGCALVALKPEGERKVKAAEVYFSRDLQNHHGGVVLVGGFLYGFHGDNLLKCLEWKTGRVKWQARSVGKCSLVAADGCLYLLSQDGIVGLAEANPEAYHEISRFRVEHGRQPSWAHPVVAGGRLFIRTQDRLRTYSVAAKAEAEN